MNATESVLLCRFVKAMFPAQQLDELTPDAWALALADLPYDITKVAVVEIAKRHRFAAASEIRTAVARMRQIAQASVRGLCVPRPFEGDPNDIRGSLEHLRAEQRRMIELADEAIRRGAIGFKSDPLEEPSEDEFYNSLAVPVDTTKLQLAIAG